jgi:Protein of unknown function (DUF2584)
MGMPCQVNSILKLKTGQDYPAELAVGLRYEVTKEGYRIFPIDVPIALVDEHWMAYADVIIRKLTWEKGETAIAFEIHRLYLTPFSCK